MWAQLHAHLDDVLDGVQVRGWFLDEDITFPNPSSAANAEPLLVNTAGSYADRPDATLRIPNLFLAADYVRTNTDLATMEGANEAARRATNAILAATRSTAAQCRIWPLEEPAVFKPARLLDRVLWKLHRPPRSPVRVAMTGGVEPAGAVGRALLAASTLTNARRGRPTAAG